MFFFLVSAMQADNENRLEGYDACILVLGDIGRSPRMCNHAVALGTKACLFKNRTVPIRAQCLLK